MEAPRDLRVLAPAALREIPYRILIGDLGHRLRDLLTADDRSDRIARAVAVLCKGYRQPSSINGLAGSLHMSTSSLHRSSKRRRRFSAAVVPETAALARNVVADDDRRSGSQNRRAPRRLRKPVAVQPLIQTPVRYANALGDRIGQGLHQR